MKTIRLIAISLVMLTALVLSVSIAVAGDPGFEGNQACADCLERARQARDQCYLEWDYGMGDPDCDAKYSQAEAACQIEVCIY